MSQPSKRRLSPVSSQSKRRHLSDEESVTDMDVLSQYPPSPEPPLISMSEVNSFHSGNDIITSISFHKSNTRYAIGGINKYLLIYDWSDSLKQKNPEPRPIWEVYTRSKISSVLFSPNSDELFAGCYDGVVKSFSLESKSRDPVEISSFPGKVWSIDSHPEQPDLLASASDDGTAAIVDRRVFHKMAWMVTCIRMMESATCVKFRKPTELCVTCADKSVRLYDIRSLRKPAVQFNRSQHTKAVSYVSLSGEHIVSSGIDSCVRVWSECGDSIRKYSSHKNQRHFTGLCSTSELISVGSEDNRVFVYNKHFQSPVHIRPLYSKFPHTFVSSVTFDLAGEFLVAANSVGYVSLLRLEKYHSEI